MIEIGSLYGESALIFNSSNKFQNIYCIDPWESNYDDLDVNSYVDLSEVEKQLYINIKRYKNIIKIKGSSNEIFKTWNKKVDLIYIDANHKYEKVLEDILNWKSFVNFGGIIAGHDYSKHDNWQYFPGVSQAVDEVFGKPDLILPDTSWIKFI
jgi:predicted O-methyltransferase YrrM